MLEGHGGNAGLEGRTPAPLLCPSPAPYGHGSQQRHARLTRLHRAPTEAAVKRRRACRTAPAPLPCPATSATPQHRGFPAASRPLQPQPGPAARGCSSPGPAPSAAKRAAKPLIRPSATSGTAEPRPPRCPAATRAAPAARWTQRWHSGASSRLQLRARQNAAALPRGRQQGLARCPAGTGRKARETRIYRQQNEQRS